MKAIGWSELRRKAPIYLAFAATGVGLTIPGAVLPLLLRRWSMSDTRGGVLLACFYGVGMVGSYTARGRMNRSVALGMVLTAMGAVCLAEAGSLSAYAAVALYGFGLSLTMTSLSLLLSQRFPAQRRLELTRLNLIWAIGAALGPWIALRATHAGAMRHAQHVLMGVAAFFVLGALWSLWMEASPTAVAVEAPGLKARGGMIPWTLLVLIFGAAGVDAAAGGWLTSYAQRAGDSLGITIGAASFLWVGSLASRVVYSTSWAARLPERRVLMVSFAAMTAALALLVGWPQGVVTMIAAAVLGLAAGPVYPLVVAAALRERENSTVFAMAGVGSSVLPLMTGAVSSWTHSLRAGLGIPLVAAMVMVGVVMVAGGALRSEAEVGASRG